MKDTTKKWLIPLSKAVTFAVLFLLIFSLLIPLFMGKQYNEHMALIEKQPDGAYDVILAGPSHMQFAVQPAQLFGEYGIAAANVCTTAQSIPNTYFIVKEMIQRHDPKLVVVDVFSLYYPELVYDPARVHQVFDFFPNTETKIEAIETLVQENRMEFYFPFLYYHNRWKELDREDYMMYFSTNETYQLLPGLYSFTEPFTPVPVEQTAQIPEIPLMYLKKIVELCEQTDTQLFLTVVPYRADVNNNDVEAVYQQQIFNRAAQLAEEWGVEFLNGLHYLEEMDFDFTTDMVEWSHVTPLGGVKATRFYGKYLREHFDIPNRYEDEAYAHWHADYAEYLKALEAHYAQG